MGIRFSCNMMKVVLICLFFSTAASANTPSLCKRLLNSLFSTTLPSKTAVLEWGIKQRFYERHGLRIKTLERAMGVSDDDYSIGLSNLEEALDFDVPIWNSVQFDSVYITRRGDTSVRLDIFGEPYVNIPSNMSRHSSPSLLFTLSSSLMEFGIERKIRKRKGILGIVGGRENFSHRLEYNNALENFYDVLETGLVPEELGKLYEISITKEKNISFSFWSSDISNEGLFRASLNVPAHAVRDLEGMAVAVLESEVTSRLAKNYSWRGYRRDIDNVMVVEDGVNRKAYKEVLKKLIAKLIDSSIMVPNKARSGNTGGVDLANLQRIHITKVGSQFTAHHYSASDGTPLVDLFFPENAVIDPLAFPHLLSPSL